MKKPSNTPETDAFCYPPAGTKLPDLQEVKDFARKLERERDAARALVGGCNRALAVIKCISSNRPAAMDLKNAVTVADLALKGEFPQ